MRARERSQLRRFRRVESFVANLRGPLARLALEVVRARLHGIIEKIEKCAGEYDTVRRLSRRKSREHAALLEDIRDDHMLPISQFAASRIEAPAGLARALRVPHKRNAVRKTLAAAHGIANVAARHAEWFMAEGIGRDFLAKYREALADVDRVSAERDTLRRRQVEAGAAIQVELLKGKRAVLALNAVLRRDLKKEPELLATWRTIKRTGD